MIFLTTGTQLPFDRLVRLVDFAAAQLDEPVFGQIGLGGYTPQHFEHTGFMAQQEFRARFIAARVIVGHAGTGTIMSARAEAKPLLLMARRSALGEHRNDHQQATLTQMRHIPGIYALDDDTDFLALLRQESLTVMADTQTPQRTRLVARLSQEIAGSAR